MLKYNDILCLKAAGNPIQRGHETMKKQWNSKKYFITVLLMVLCCLVGMSAEAKSQAEAPTLLKAYAKSDTAARLVWEKAEAAQGYILDAEGGAFLIGRETARNVRGLRWKENSFPVCSRTDYKISFLTAKEE